MSPARRRAARGSAPAREIDESLVDDEQPALLRHAPRDRGETLGRLQPPIRIIGIDDDADLGRAPARRASTTRSTVAPAARQAAACSS